MNYVKLFLTLLALAGMNLCANAQVTTIDSGYCGANGNNLEWKLTSDSVLSDSVLTISGTGAMQDYNWDGINGSNAPWAIYQNSSTTLVIESGVTSIGGFAFHEFRGLTGNLTLPDGLTSIGFKSCYSCGFNGSLTLPDGLTNIGGEAFTACGFTGSLTLPNGLTNIGAGAFANCINLTSINIPNSITSIEGWTFGGCSSLNSVTIGNSVTHIRNDAFRDCQSLTSIIFPNSVTYLDGGAFRGSGLTSLKLPDMIDTICGEAFRDCGNLAGKLFIPQSLKHLGGGAFCSCSKLTEVTVYWTQPLQVIVDPNYWLSHPFVGINLSKVNLYVPVGTENSYQGADCWKDFNVLPNYTRISGTILCHDSTPFTSGGLVKLYYSHLDTEDTSVRVDSDGTYCFTDVLNGKYIIKVVPDSLNLSYRFYGDTNEWENAKIVEIDSNRSKDSADIILLPPLPPLNGTSIINGLLKEAEEDKGITRKKGERDFPGEDVILKRKINGNNWETVARTITNDTGHFEFRNVDTGTFTLSVSIPNMELIDPPFLGINSDTSIYVELTLKSLVVGIKEVVQEGTKLKVYPNPTTGQLTIDNGELIIENVEIYNVVGQMVLSCRDVARNVLTIDVKSLASGLYFLKVNNKVVKFVKE